MFSDSSLVTFDSVKCKVIPEWEMEITCTIGYSIIRRNFFATQRKCYRACPRCKSSIQNLDDKLWCKNCCFIDSLPIPWYRIRLIVQDNTGTAAFVLFGRLAADLFGVPAQTLAASFKERHETPPMLTKLYGIQKSFQLQLGNFVEDPDKISFKSETFNKRSNSKYNTHQKTSKRGRCKFFKEMMSLLTLATSTAKQIPPTQSCCYLLSTNILY
ncbi:hypothetical protein M5689_010739 [Euphorbia peplus]|nr:hypothetical protein M5689_010739 [Euphorbia peplus]